VVDGCDPISMGDGSLDEKGVGGSGGMEKGRRVVSGAEKGGNE